MKTLENFLAGFITAGIICMIVFALTSCSLGRRGMKNCDFIQTKMSGYKY